MIGKILAHYEVTGLLGRGGMGEVYRAKDTRLDREVAIKVLPAGAGEHEEFRARFEREARVISALNHPNICTLYDIGQEDGTHFLVMELIEGESLAVRLERGALPADEVLAYGAQVATALDEAHQLGITHRDLKPANVMLTRTGAKLLDFGLAAQSAASSPLRGLSAVATEAMPLTTEGAILGTFQYMAPEQLEGLAADARTDIFALGALLYQMATGRRAFEAETRTSLISEIVSAQPRPISALAAISHPALDHVVERCLEKDPDDRWQSARDVAFELQWIGAEGSPGGAPGPQIPAPRLRPGILWAIAAAGWFAAVSAVGWRSLAPGAPSEDVEIFRSDLAPPPGLGYSGVSSGGAVQLSSAGDRLAFVTFGDKGAVLAVRDLASGQVQVLEGTEGAWDPSWSPDGDWLAFFAETKLKKVPSRGGTVQILAEAAAGRGGTWNAAGTIVFAADISGPLLRVSDNGGTPQPVTTVPEADFTHRCPHFLPGGERFLFIERKIQHDPIGRIAIGSLEGSPHATLVDRGSNPQWAGGYLFFARDGNLVAQSFPLNRLELEGPVAVVAPDVEYYNPRDLGNFSVSAAGVLVYRQREIVATQLAWYDLGIRKLAELTEPSPILWVRSVNADRSRAAVVREDDAGLSSDIWIADLARRQLTRATFLETAGAIWAALSSSGDRLAVSSYAGKGTTGTSTWIQSISGQGAKEVLFESASFQVTDWSRDGRFLLGHVQEKATSHDVAYVDLTQPPEVKVLVSSQFWEAVPAISPDGRWVAYWSGETGQDEIFVTDFPGGTSKWQVSREGGTYPEWSSGGSAIYFRSNQGIFEVPFSGGDDPDVGKPGLLVASDAAPEDLLSLPAVAGDRILGLRHAEKPTPEPFRVILNWLPLLEEGAVRGRSG